MATWRWSWRISTAKSVVISGTVKGNVIGNASVELKSTAKVEGDITAPKFVLEEGASLSGKVDTGTKKALRAYGLTVLGPKPKTASP